jgi:drug/metabolite transporter (DMT)-like permease
VTLEEPSRTSHAPLKGILLVLSAAVIFAIMDAVGKYLMMRFSVPFVAGIRYALNMILLAAFVMPRHGTRLWQTNQTKLVGIRGTSLACATFFGGLTLQRLPVGEAVSLFYLQGFGVMLAAGYFLKEKISWVGWAAAITGFAGVMLIARPGGNLEPIGVVFGIICATISVTYIFLSRSLAATENTMALMFHVGLAGTVLFGVTLAFNWHPFLPSPTEWAMLFFMGAASLLAHFLLTSAYRFAPASMLAPFNYFHIAFAVLTGWLVYDHLPDTYSFVGMAMIAVSGATLALYTHFKKSVAALN